MKYNDSENIKKMAALRSEYVARVEYRYQVMGLIVQKALKSCKEGFEEC